MRRYLRLFQRFAVRDTLQNRVRSALTVTGVSLGIAVVVAVHLANANAIDSFDQNVRLFSGQADLQISANGLPLDESLVRTLSWIWEEGVMAPVIEGRAGVAREQGSTDVRVYGIDLLSDASFRQYTLENKRDLALDITRDEFIDLLLDPSQIILPASLARRLDLQRGSRLGLLIADSQKEFTVGALLLDEGIATLPETSPFSISLQHSSRLENLALWIVSMCFLRIVLDSARWRPASGASSRQPQSFQSRRILRLKMKRCCVPFATISGRSATSR